MHRNGYRRSRVDAGKLFDRQRVRDVVGAGAAVLFGHENSHDPGVGELAVELARKDVIAIPLRDVRRDLTLCDLRG